MAGDEQKLAEDKSERRDQMVRLMYVVVLALAWFLLMFQGESPCSSEHKYFFGKRLTDLLPDWRLLPVPEFPLSHRCVAHAANVHTVLASLGVPIGLALSPVYEIFYRIYLVVRSRFSRIPLSASQRNRLSRPLFPGWLRYLLPPFYFRMVAQLIGSQTRKEVRTNAGPTAPAVKPTTHLNKGISGDPPQRRRGRLSFTQTLLLLGSGIIVVLWAAAHWSIPPLRINPELFTPVRDAAPHFGTRAGPSPLVRSHLVAPNENCESIAALYLPDSSPSTIVVEAERLAAQNGVPYIVNGSTAHCELMPGVMLALPEDWFN